MKLISFVYSTILLLIVLKLRYNKINLTSFYPLFIGVISAAVFGFIDSIFFLTAEKSLDSYFSKLGFDDITIPLIVGAISASISLIIANYFEHFLQQKYDFIKNPFLDVIGMFIGTAVVILLYRIYKFHIKNKDTK